MVKKPSDTTTRACTGFEQPMDQGLGLSHMLQQKSNHLKGIYYYMMVLAKHINSIIHDLEGSFGGRTQEPKGLQASRKIEEALRRGTHITQFPDTGLPRCKC